MAKSETISLLHPTEPSGAEVRADSSSEQLEANNPGNARVSPPAVRGRFVLPAREQAESYTLDANVIRNIVEPAGPMDRSDDLRALAAQQQFLQFARWRRRAAGQRAGKSAAGPLTIHC
jgi:hypothetical protein